MRNLFYFLVVFCFLTACQQKRNDIGGNLPVQTIQWKTEKDFVLKDIVKTVRYIALEDREESLFSSIDKLLIKNDRIYILDIFGSKSLLVFDISGKFLHQVGRMGNGPGEYTQQVINFDVKDNNDVYLYDYGKRNMMVYDMNGKYVESFKSSFTIIDFCILPSNNYLLSLDNHEKNNENKKVALSNDLNSIISGHFEYSKDFKDAKFNRRSFQPFRDKIAYMPPVSDSLWIINQKGDLESAYFFDFGNEAMPDELKNSAMKESEKRRNGIYYTSINKTPVVFQNYIFANLIRENSKYIAVFDVENNKSTYEKLTPDSFDVNNINFPLCSINDSILVSYLDANLYPAVADKITLDDAIRQHLSDGGAVICLYTIK